MSEPFEALNKARRSHREIDFCLEENPKCPHCGETYDVMEHENYDLYEFEEEQKIHCPSCDREFVVSVHWAFTFSTDEADQR